MPELCKMVLSFLNINEMYVAGLPVQMLVRKVVPDHRQGLKQKETIQGMMPSCRSIIKKVQLVTLVEQIVHKV